jgi:predicted nucleic acid-binding protein
MPDVISDSSCLIALDNIGMLFILKKLYGKIYISEEVADEFGKKTEDWIETRQVRDKNYVKILNTLIDLGESGAIALSFEFSNSLLILDDLKARKVAKNLNLKFTGLLGIILRAEQKGIINSVKDVINRLKSANFRISQAIEKEVLRLADEDC